jgi:hypothetical protein
VHDDVSLPEDFSEPNGKKKKKKKDKSHKKDKTHKDKVDERDASARIATVGVFAPLVQLSKPSVVHEYVAGTSTEAPLALVDESEDPGTSKKKNKKHKKEQKEGSESPAREEQLQAVKKEKFFV